jgi:integrase
MAALDGPTVTDFRDRLLVELDITTGMRSGEIRRLLWQCVDLDGARIHIETQRRGAAQTTPPKREQHPHRADPLIPDPRLRKWKLMCPPPGDLVFPGEPDANGVRGPIDADKLLRNILRRALQKAGLPPLRFHDITHLGGRS